jgi:hypothetical protein
MTTRERPEAGETVFACAHLPDVQLATMRVVDDEIAVQVDESQFVRSKWLAICHACQTLAPSADDLHKALTDSVIGIGGEMTWPADDAAVPPWNAVEVEPEFYGDPEAEEALRRATPPGYVREFVLPDWAHKPASERGQFCRACHASQDTAPSVEWGISTMMRLDEKKKTLFFSFAMVCSNCGQDERKMQALANRLFDQVVTGGFRIS